MRHFLNKIQLGLIGVGISLADVVSASRAGDNLRQTAGASFDTSKTALSGQAGLVAVVMRLLQVALFTVGTILFVIIIYAGWLYMTAGGNDDQVGKARKWVRNGLLGLLLIIMANIIVTFILVAAQDVTVAGSPSTSFWSGFMGSFLGLSQ